MSSFLFFFLFFFICTLAGLDIIYFKLDSEAVLELTRFSWNMPILYDAMSKENEACVSDEVEFALPIDDSS